MKCPHCEAKLKEHDGSKAGRAHCDSCGCCFVIETGEVLGAGCYATQATYTPRPLKKRPEPPAA